MTQIVAEEQLRLREKLMRKPKPTTNNDEKRTKFLFFTLIKSTFSFIHSDSREKTSSSDETKS
jgi:hypothetical protein